MGLFDGIKNTFSGAAKTVGLIGEGLGFGPNRTPQPFVPEVDPRLGQISGQQTQQAQDFRQNLPNYTNDKYNIAADQARTNLSQQLGGIRSQASGRGLLYSGLRAGQEGSATGAAISNLATQRAGINRDAENQARSMETGAINSGIDLQQAEQARQDALYNSALQQYMNKKTPAKSIGNILGSVGGVAAAGGFNQGNDASTASPGA